MSEEAASFLQRAKTRSKGVSQLTRLGRLSSTISLTSEESYVQGRDNHDADDRGREGFKNRVRRFIWFSGAWLARREKAEARSAKRDNEAGLVFSPQAV